MAGGGGNTVTKSDPWSGAQPFLKDVMGQASQLYQQGGPQQITGTQTVGPTQGQLAGWDQSLNYADQVFGNQQAPQFGQATSALGSMLSGKPDYSAVNASTGAANQQVMNQFTNQFIPQMNAKASYLQNPTGAIKDTNWAMSQLGQNMDLNTQQAYLGQYDLAQQRQQAGLGLFPSISQLGAIPGQIAQQYGDWGAGFQNQNLQNQVSQYNYEQQLPYQNLQNYAGTINGYGGLGGQSSSGYNPSTGQQAAGVAGGALAGAQLGSMIGPWGTAIGAVGGGLMGAFSDRRLKEDIQRVGTLESGLPVYRYRLRGEANYQLGVMADEAREHFPEAVSRGPDGYDRVRYEELQ